MLNETFYIDGVDARNFGIYLQKPIEFSEAIPIVDRQSIPGRNGDLIFETGAYENRTATASCFCLQKDVEKALSAAGRFLMSKHGYRRLETSDDPDHFWLARIENSPAISQRMRTLAPFEITFDCKPQRFLKSGENSIILENSEGVLVDKIYNPYGFPALPLLHAKWSVGENNFITVLFEGEEGQRHVMIFGITGNDVYIDCDTHNIYNDLGNQNSHVNVYDFPRLDAGMTHLSSAISPNLEYLEIIPRWWEL
jgi:phage-related protein